MNESPTSSRRASPFFTAVTEPQIVLAALARLRWLAVVGQVAAAVVGVFALHLRLPLLPIGALILFTCASNVALALLMRWPGPAAWLVRVVLLLDIGLFTSLLYLTGGPRNPFAALYLVHVAMAVIVLEAFWTWVVVATVAICYAVLLRWHQPLDPGGALPAWALVGGNWIGLTLVSVLIAVFVGHIARALRMREMELADARERAARNERLASLTTLAAGAAHELNTPLGTIAVVAKEMELASVAAGIESVAEDARLVRREVDRCRHILGRMRFDLGADGSQPAEVLVDEIVSRLRDALQPDEAARLRVHRQASVAGCVMAPPVALEQALLVLLRNAFDASPPDAPVVLSISAAAGEVRFAVTDQGCGMSPEMLRHAGEPFYTTKEPGKGMGLGLFLVRLVAERCGARFDIESQPGRGTRCVMDLPTALRQIGSLPGGAHNGGSILADGAAPACRAPGVGDGTEHS